MIISRCERIIKQTKSADAIQTKLHARGEKKTITLPRLVESFIKFHGPFEERHRSSFLPPWRRAAVGMYKNKTGRDARAHTATAKAPGLGVLSTRGL